MKILLVIPTYLPIIGGAELAVHNIAKSLIENCVQADVMCFNVQDIRWNTKLSSVEEYCDGVKVYRIGAFNPLLPFNKTKYKSVFCRYLGVQIIPDPKFLRIYNNYDLIHFNDEVNLSLPFFSQFTKKPRLFHIRTLIQLYHSFERSKLATYVLRRSGDKFIAETENYIQGLIKLGIPEEKLILWQKGVDTRKFVPINKYDKDTILFVGRIDDKLKGLSVLLDSLSFVKRPIKLKIIGTCDKQNDYVRKIFNQIERINTDNHGQIEYLDTKNQDELVQYYQKSAVFVCPSIKDTMPNVILEALACGTPVVASDTGGINKIVRNNKTGILVEPGNAFGLSKAISKLLSDHEFRMGLGREGREFVVRNNSQGASIKNLIGIYKELIHQYKGNQNR